MMRLKCFPACVFFFFFCLTANLVAQDTAFWFVAPHMSEVPGGPDNIPFNRPAFLAVSNGTFQTAHVEITLYNGGTPLTIPATVAPGGLYKHDFNLPPNTATNTDIQCIENPRGRAGDVVAYGTHIRSDVRVTVYYMLNHTETRDIFTLKGRQALGTRFYVPMQSDNAAAGSSMFGGVDQIDIVATEDNTLVTVTPGAAVVNTSGSGPNPSPAGTAIQRTLDRGQTLKIMEHSMNSYPSLAGTSIVSDRPVAVTVTEDLVQGDTSGDQIVPVSSLGTRYIVPRGYRTAANLERFYLVGTAAGTTAKIYATVGSDVYTPVALGAGTVARYNFPANVNAVYVEANEPVYVYQRSGYGEEGAALLPGVYSIGQTQLSFYQVYVPNPAYAVQKGFLVFRAGAEGSFTIAYGSNPAVSLGLSPLDIPHVPEWKVARFDYEAPPSAGRVIRIQSTQSAFSLGYIAGNTTVNDSYGYFSAFGDFEFAGGDTTWMCGQSVTLQGGYAMSYEWAFNGVPLDVPPSASSIAATEEGTYTLVMHQDPNTVTASTVVKKANAGTVSPALHRHCTPVALTVSGASEPAGTQYQWQSNTTDPADEAAWADIPGATSASYVPPYSPQTVWYRRGMSSDFCAMAYTGSARVSLCTVPVNPHLRSRVTGN